MKNQLIDISEADAKKILPAHICKKVSEKKAYVFCGEENEEIVSIAVFSESQSDRVMLEYIQVPENLRRMGYAHELMEYCYATFSRAGVKRIFCKCSDTLEGLQLMYKFLLSEEFIPLTFDGHLIEYYVQDLMDSPMIRRILEQYEQIPNVISITDTKHPYLKDFSVHCKEMSTCLNWDIFDLKWSRFYVQNERIVGTFLSRRVDERTLYIPITFVDKGKIDMKAFVLLLAACVQQVQQEMPEDAIIKLQALEADTYHAMQKICDDSETDYLLQEYVRILNE